jgi:hypothetical protein
MSSELKLEAYAKLLEQRRAAVKKWNKQNKDKVDIYKKRYLEKNRNKSIKYATNYNTNNKDKYKEYQLLYRSSRLLRQLPFWGEYVEHNDATTE